MHEIFLPADNFTAPLEARIFECLHNFAILMQAKLIMVWTPGSAMHQPALHAELQAVFIQPVVPGVDINRHSVRVIAEAGAIAARINIAARAPDTIADDRVDFLTLLQQPLQRLLH